MRQFAVLAAACALTFAGCSGNNAAGTWPKGGAAIPDANFHVTPSTTLALEKLVYWGGVAAVAYYVTDPLAPNWEIREAAFPDNHYRLSLQMKRYYAGGAGEARVVFNRRADELMRKGGFDGYQIVDYSERLESSVLGSQRVTEGTVSLTRSAALQGSAAPARNTAPSAANPRS